MTVLHLIPHDTRLSANQILVAWCVVIFAATVAVGLTLGITVEILFGFGAVFATWPIALLAIRHDKHLLLGNPERFRGIGE